MTTFASPLARFGLAALLALPALSGSTTAAAPGRQVTYGADVSWPNCPKGEGIPSRRTKGEPMPKRSARFVVVGVTNGPGFHPNPCLARQLHWVNTHHRLLGGYALTTYPTPAQVRRYGSTGPFPGTGRKAGLRNTGYAEASYNVQAMIRVGLAVPMIWVDVEPYPVAPWSHDLAANRAVVTGVIRGYRDLGYPIGLYTYANGWREVVGSWRLPKYPTWSTAGRSTAPHALARCSHSPSGGRTWLAQWWRNKRHDYDLLCPAASHRTSRMFSQPAPS